MGIKSCTGMEDSLMPNTRFIKLGNSDLGWNLVLTDVSVNFLFLEGTNVNVKHQGGPPGRSLRRYGSEGRCHQCSRCGEVLHLLMQFFLAVPTSCNRMSGRTWQLRG